ncbi:hypothetical protein LCGC14_0303090 [marine sediment metagenome]|uniref:PrsW family intramembrane metalloprotease n=1 Tax=marine sediment metagenome TaxID=412755 RepID=A0A0F9WVS1_9ZZZZ
MMLVALLLMVSLPIGFLILYIEGANRKPDYLLFIFSGIIIVFLASIFNWMFLFPFVELQHLWIAIVEETLKISLFYMVSNKMKSDKIVEIGLSFALWENILYAFAINSPIAFLDYWQIAIIRLPATILHFALALMVINIAKQKDNRLWLLLPIAHWLGNLLILSLPPIAFATG